MRTGGNHRERISPDALDALKARKSLADVVARHVKLKRAGKELTGLCPVHNERTPSFRVNEAKGQFYCFGCGISGDIIDFLKLVDGMTFIQALEVLNDGTLPDVDPRARAAAREADAAERAAGIADALEVWERGVDPRGTPAERYIREARQLRGVELPDTIRFVRTWAWRDRETGEVGDDLPCLACAVQDVNGNITGLQRIFLADGGRAKAKMKRPKLSLGHLRGGAFRLGPPAREIVIVEGPEDGLTLKQQMPDRSIWVACGTSLMPLVQLPDEVEAVILAGDNNAAGRAAVAATAESIALRGRRVRAVYPTEGFKDWNDEFRGVRS